MMVSQWPDKLPRSRILFFAFLLLTLQLNAAMASNEFYRLPLSVLVDASGSLSLDDIVNAPDEYVFKPVEGQGYAGGYTRAVHWFKVEIHPLANVSGLNFVKFHPATLDNITLYIPDPNQQYQIYHAGDAMPYSQARVPYRGHVIVIPIPEHSVIAYIRLETSGSSSLFVSVQTPAHFYRESMLEYLALGTYLGAWATVIILSLYQMLWLRQPTFRYYLLHLLAIILVIFSSEGFLGSLLLRNSPILVNQLTALSVLLLVGSGALFYKHLLRINFQRDPLFQSLITLILGLSVLGIFATLLGYYTVIIPYILMISAIGGFFLMLRSARLLRHGNREAKWIFTGAIVGIAGFLISALTTLGLLPGYQLTLHMFHMTSLVSFLCFQLVMNLRVKEIRESVQTARISEEKALKEVELEKSYNEIQSRFLSMLHHELRSPLSVIRLVLGMKAPSDTARRHANEAVANIDAIIERCAHSDKLDHEQFRPRIEKVDIKALVKAIIDNNEQKDRIELSCSYDSLDIQSDSELLKVVFKNLIDNALKYARADSPISIELTRVGSGLGADHFVSIRNTVDDYQSIDTVRIFDRYVRMPGSERTSGSGLGLFIVKGLLKSIYADIECCLTGNQIEFKVCL